ncbi:MAG: EAL domain-containing protein [Candidatus Eremiobacteraeota bacterium]|nr:EAL domain-containing protein [Candidatus Eremiobacteraeota bacterium]
MPLVRFPPHVVASAALVALAAAALPFGHARVAGAGAVVPLMLVAAAVAETVTFAVLIALYAREPRRSTGFLAFSYLAAAVFTCLQAGSLPLAPSAPPAFPAASQTAAWMYVLCHLGFAVCAIVYARLRHPDEYQLTGAQARRYLRWTAAGFVAVTVLAVAAVLTAGERLVIVHGLHIGFSNGPRGSLLIAACIVATVVVFRRGVRDGVDAGLTLALVAVTLDVALNFYAGERFVVAWYAARILIVGASTFVLIASIRDLMLWRTRALHLGDLLAVQLHRVEHHSQRLESLWRLASQPPLDDEAFLAAVLDEASKAIHPGPPFYGVLAHLDGAEIVIDVNRCGDDIDQALVPGARLPFKQTLLSELLRTGRTCSWDDVHTHPELAAIPRVDEMPWRAFIGTPLRVGPTVYFLTFTSLTALVEPFAPDDHAYLEIVASFCASRLQQRVQFERLRHQSTHDSLTGLPNRAAFRAKAVEALAACPNVALAVVDVDRFRAVNESLGHQTADAVLVEVAAALTARVSEGDVVARIGGDVFGVLLRDATRAGAERRVERLHAAFAQPFGTGDREGKERVAVTASIGVALAPHDGPVFEKLLARADAAVRSSKERGRARWSFYDVRDADAFAAARKLQNDIAEALVREEFVLRFQPHVELATGRVVGAEALIRWRHPERGLLAPAEFFPLAEAHGMAGAIGAWVMRETVRASRAWRAADPAFRAWFNLSALELSDPALLRQIRELGEELRGVGAEISESIAMRDVHATMRTVADLREAGLLIALDDFGTGYSSLAHLKRLPIDVVKIDGTFTAGVPNDPHDAAIVEAVVGIATRYGFETVAEGVETMEQAAYLRSVGCDLAQGFAYAPPMAAADFEAWLRAARNTPRAGAYIRA